LFPVTRPVSQELAAAPAEPAAEERRRRNVVAGAYLLRRAAGTRQLAALGHPADVVVTSQGLLFDAIQARRGLSGAIVGAAPDLGRLDVGALSGGGEGPDARVLRLDEEVQQLRQPPPSAVPDGAEDQVVDTVHADGGPFRG
jgi:hypothetical protein